MRWNPRERFVQQTFAFGGLLFWRRCAFGRCRGKPPGKRPPFEARAEQTVVARSRTGFLVKSLAKVPKLSVPSASCGSRAARTASCMSSGRATSTAVVFVNDELSSGTTDST